MIVKYFKNKENLREIFRFVVVGLICTLADYGVSLLFQYLVYPDQNLTTFVASLAGFVVGVLINYLLSIFAVFKNVENKKTSQSIGGFFVFIGLSTVGYLINLGIKELGNLIIPFASSVLWFTFIFGVATFVVLIYNYVTRKFILFKPKKEADLSENE